MKALSASRRFQGCNRPRAGYVVMAFLSVLVAVGSPAAPLRLASVPGVGYGPPAGGAGDSSLPIMSRDGRFVLFASTANNLSSMETNKPLTAVAPLNVFLRDRVKGTTALVSVNLSGGGGGDADSIPIGVSTNGRYALFESSASNLVPGDTNNAGDVFLRDIETGLTRLVSVATNGGFGDNSSYNSAMTPDARYVAFASAASNLVAGDTNGIPDVFIRDLENNVTTLVSVGARLRTNNLTVESDAPALTPDGRYVLFYSTASNLAAGVQTAGDLFLRDQVSGNTTWVSAAAKSLLATLGKVTNSVSFNSVLSDDGRFIAFEAMAFPSGTPAATLRYDLQTGQTDLIDTNAVPAFSGSYGGIQDLGMTPDGQSVAYVANVINTSVSTTAIRVWNASSGVSVLASGNIANGVLAGTLADSPVISDDARFVGFVSDAPNLVTNDVTEDFHIYLRDLQTATTMLVDTDTNGVGALLDPVGGLVMSADGHVLAFDSQDTSFVVGDNNHAYDVFARDLGRTEVELISAHDPALGSATADGASFCSSYGVSSDGRYLAFSSEADDLVANDSNGQRDVFVYDMTPQTTTLVSVNTNGTVADGFSTDGSISADGRYLAFTSQADDLVAGDTNRAQDVFVRDLQTRITVLASVNAAGTGPGNSDSYSPILAGNGQSVLFRSRAANLTSPGALAGTENLFWRDLVSKKTYSLSTNGVMDAMMTPDGNLVAYTASSTRFATSADRVFVWSSQSNQFLYSLFGAGFSSIAISPDGRRLAYITNTLAGKQLVGVDRVSSTNRVIAANVSDSGSPIRFDPSSRYLAYLEKLSTTGAVTQVYLFDFETGNNQLISRGYDGVSPGDQSSDSVDMTHGARFIAYRSAATNLVPGDTNGEPDIFLYDRANDTTLLVSANRFGNTSGNSRSLTPVFSGDGQILVFTSWASDLLANDFNNEADVFTLAVSDSGLIPDFFVVSFAEPGPSASTWLTWPAITGRSYQVQFKNQLSDSQWLDLAQPISMIGTKAFVQDRGQVVGHRFYRVLAH